MKQSPPQEVSALLPAWSGGDELALVRLIPIVYEELHRVHFFAKLWLPKELKQE